MSFMVSVVKRSLSNAYLHLGHAHLRTRLHARSPRCFKKVRIVTELSRNNGIVQGARLQLDLLLSCGIDAEIVDATPAARNPLFRAKHSPGTVYIFHSGGPQMPNLIRSVLPSAANAYRIAYWAWEMPVPPRGYLSPHPLVHEIWTCSQFAKSSLQPLSAVPVRVVPHVLNKSAVSPKQLGSPFEVLAFADSRSSLPRKNPLGAIHAFKQAFGQSQAARLTLKLNGRPEELAPVIEQASAPNIRVLTEFLPEDALLRLYDSSHVLLSLHRAEGFGLPIFEAMSRGLPVIATGWSGNLDFMSPENSLPVPCICIPIGNDPVYHSYADAHWAEPDTGVAAKYLRQLASDGNFYHRYSTLALDAVVSFTTNQRQHFAVETLHA